MRLVKFVANGLYNYEEVGILAITNDNAYEMYVQEDIDSIVGEFENKNEDYFISDIVDELKAIGYKCEFVPCMNVEEVEI